MKKKNKPTDDAAAPEREVVIHGPTLYMRAGGNAYLRREFLNQAASIETSYVLAVVANSSEGRFVDGFNALVLCDSTRIVCLEFPLTQRARNASLAKIEVLTNVLREFRDALLFEATAIENTGEGVDQ